VRNSSEISVLRLKPRAGTLLLPTFALALVSFALAFVADQFSPADYEIALMAGALVAVLFWAFPMLSYLGSYLELTDQRIIYRSGFLGFRKRQLPLTELSSLEIQKSGRLGGQEISILSVDGSELVIRGYAKAKYLAAEIEALAKATV
jgi:hypothetical protein